jgi:hypothetical protein
VTDDDPNEAYEAVAIEPGPHDPPRLPVNKITWPQVGRVTEPGRYMFTFGWLTVTAEDLAIWEKQSECSLHTLQHGDGTRKRNSRGISSRHLRIAGKSFAQ